MKPIRISRFDDTDKGPYIVSDLRDRFGRLLRIKFHRWNCKWVKKMELKNRRMFRTHADAVAAGRKPCGTCCA